MESYKMPVSAAKAEFTEKKSRFISHVSPASSEDDALAFLRSIREKHREASHNVYAYRIKNGGFCRYSDDGEPSGTAGKPLMEVFIKQDIYDFCCVATRYYGGVNLGAGGLIRAYARCGSIGLDASGVGVMRELAMCSVTLPYSMYEQIKRLLLSNSADIASEDFGAEVAISFYVPSETLPQLQSSLSELTLGSVTARIEDVILSSWQS